MTDKKLYRLVNLGAILTVFICIAIVVGISQSQVPISVNEKITKYNVDSLRRVYRALEIERRESELKNLEDSIHYFEDGM